MRHLESLTSGQSPIRVLHNAPEMAIAKGLNFYKNPSVDYVGFDYYVGPLVYKTSLNEFRFDISNIPFPDEYFHMVITSHVLEHVPSLNKSISELYRVLKPGGVGFIAFPANFKIKHTIEDGGLPMTEEERQRKFGQKDHVRLIGRDIMQIIKSVGFIWDVNKSHRPHLFYKRPEISAKIAAFKNVEYISSRDTHGKVLFVYKPNGKSSPPGFMST